MDKAQFRKRPIIVEAMQITKDAAQFRRVYDWIGDEVKEWDDEPFSIRIRTLEGEMWAREGDWIIKGVQGEFYPCKPDIFAATYEPADQPPSASGERDTARLTFVIERDTSWYPGRAANGQGILCFSMPRGFLGPRQEAVGRTMREAIDNAIVQFEAATGTKEYSAPSPGIDAAEQKPVAEVVWIDAALHSGQPSGKEIDCSMAWLEAAPIGTNLYAAPPSAQLSAEWMAEAERLVDAYAKEFAQGGATYARDIHRAALLAYLRTKL